MSDFQNLKYFVFVHFIFIFLMEGFPSFGAFNKYFFSLSIFSLSYNISLFGGGFPGFQVSEVPSFQGRKGGREGELMRGLATDHMISGPMGGLKNLHQMVQTDRQI